MHFDASAGSIQMTVDLISSANFSMFVGICDQLGKNKNESKKCCALVVLVQKVWDKVYLLRPNAAERLSSFAPTADGNVDAGASSFEEKIGRNQQISKAVVERATQKTDQEIARLCRVADHAEILKICGRFVLIGASVECC